MLADRGYALTGHEMVLAAVAFATEAHAGQVRKGPPGAPKVPYITHPMAAKTVLESVGVFDPVVLAAAVLHDTMEDCGVSRETLAKMFGSAVASVVAEVTDDPGLGKNEKKDAQEAKAPGMSWAAKAVKMADKTANMTDLVEHPPGWKPGSVRGYVASATRIVAAMGRVHEGLEAAFAAAAARATSSAG